MRRPSTRLEKASPKKISSDTESRIDTPAVSDTERLDPDHNLSDLVSEDEGDQQDIEWKVRDHLTFGTGNAAERNTRRITRCS